MVLGDSELVVVYIVKRPGIWTIYYFGDSCPSVTAGDVGGDVCLSFRFGTQQGKNAFAA